MNTIVEHINSAGNAFVEFALPMLIQSSVLIVILLFLDFLLRKKVKAVFRYWIWMLVLLKLILPTSLSSPLSLGYLFGEKLTYQDLAQSSPRLEPTVPAPAEFSSGVGSIYIQPNPYIPPAEPIVSVTEPMIAETISPPQVPVTPLTWQGVVFLVWLAVVTAMGLLLLQRALFVRGLVAQAKKAGRLMNDALSYCCKSMGIKSKVGLKVSVNATTPSVCGLIRPVILVPWKLTSTLGASRLRTILMHELAHIKRGDLWVNLAQTALQIIYFYNPLLWLANFVIRRIREQAVDEAVLVAMGEKAQKYPQTLVDVAKMAFKRPALGLRLIGVVESRSALAGRIKHILSRPIPKSARLGIVGVLSILITAAILLPMAKAREATFAGQGGPLNIRLAGVRPDGSDDIYDGRGNKIAENTFANIAKEWGEGQQHRTFIFELPKTEEPILFPPFLKIKPTGVKHGFGSGQHPLLYYSDGKLKYCVGVNFPRTYKKVFERQVKKVDLTLPYYYGQRGAADFVFTGPFTPGQTVKAEGGADCELTPKEELLNFGNHPTAFFRISSRNRFDGDSVLIYDTSGRRYLLQIAGGGSGRGDTHYNYRAEGLTLNSIACVTVGEKPYEATFKNVVVSYYDRPALDKMELLDEMCERLDLTGLSGDKLFDYRFGNPADAIKVIDIVRGRWFVMQVFNAIRYSNPRIELSNLDSQAQQKVRSVAARWAKAGHPDIRAMGIRLGLVGGWPEFMDMALDWLEQDVVVYDMGLRTYRGLEEEAKGTVAGEVASYPIILNSEQAERFKRIILRTDSPRLATQLFRLFWRADKDMTYEVCRDLVQDDRPWIWWPAMYSLSNRCTEKLRPFENLPEKIQKRLILVHEAGGSSRLFHVSSSGKDYETVAKEAYAMLPGMFTARLARMDSSICHNVRQVMAKHLDREIAAKAMTDFLREISTETNQRLWAGDSPYFGTCCSTAYYIARHINSLYDANIDNLGKYEIRENPEAIPRHISQLKQLIAKTLQWYDGRSGDGNKTGIAAEIGMADRVEVQVGPLDHFVGRFAMAKHPDTAFFEITKEGDVFVFRDLGEPKFEMDILLRGLKGRKFEMEKGRDNLRFGNNPRERYSVRYNAAEGRYILDSLGMRGEVRDSMISPLTDLVKIPTEKSEDIFAVTLPNGVTVELVGLSEHPSRGKQWWKPDGTLWEDRPYEEFSSHNTSGEKGYELVWRLRSDEDVVCEVESADQGGSAGKDVLHNERGLRPAFRNGESYGVTLFFSPRLSQAAIGIGVGLDRNWKTIASLEGDVSKASSSINNVHLYPAIETDGRTYIDAAYCFPEGRRQAYRLVAVDTDDRQHVMQRGSETKGRGNIHCRKKIDLPIKRIKTIHFQIQPLQWITFENVSLRPGNKTNMQVKIEEPEPVLTDEIITAKVGPDVRQGIEETMLPEKLVMLLIVINSCAAEVDLNIDSISITDRNISIKGDTSGRTNTRKFLDTIKDNGLKVSYLSLDAADNRDKFSIIVEPKQDWQKWWQQRKTDVQLGVEENISPKLLMLLQAIADCAAETELNIKSISIKEYKIKIEGDTSSRSKINIEGDTSSKTNTLKFLDALKKNELEVLRLNFITRDDRNKFTFVAEPKKNWRQWWRKHKVDIKADVPAKEDVASKLSQLNRLSVKPPIVAYDVKLNFADPTVRDGSFHSEQSVAFSLSFHNIEIGPAEKFTLGHLLIGQTTWPVHLEENGIAIHEGVSGQKIKSLKWPAGELRFDKVIKIPVKYGNREYSCPVRVDLDRYNKDAPTGAYWFCAYLSGRLPWGAGGRGFEIVNLDQQMEFRLTGDGTDPRDAVLGIDINGDGKIDSAIEGGEQFDLYEPFIIGSKTYQLAEVDPYLPRVVFREVDAQMLPHPLAKADVPVGTEKAVVGGWEDIGNPIPADFNDTIALTEQIQLGSIGQDVEGKTFITFVWDKEKDRNRQYRFVLINKKGTVLEPDSHLIFDEKGTLEEKFTFDEPYVSWRLKEFKFQNRPLLPEENRTISSKLQKGTSTAFEGKTISPSGLAPPGRYAIELDGVDDYLLVPDSPTLRLEPPFTVEMWIKPRSPEQNPDRMQQWGVIAQGGYIGTGRVKTGGFGIELTRFEKEPATFQICYTEANDNGLFGRDYGNYSFDEWMHISHVFEGENYKPSHGHPLVVGRFLIPVPEPFMGQIGEVRIWNGARTRDEIRRYKNRALTGKEPGLAACWTFEQAEGQFAYDISGNNNHARFGKAAEADGADPKWIDLEVAAHQPGRIVNVPVEVEGTAKDEIGRLSEVGKRRTIPERRKGRIEFLGLDLTDAPRTTKSADLPDLFEERPPGSKSYEIAGGVTVIYGGFDGTVYHIPEKEVFYIQHDKLGSSTRTYYGPFDGDPKQVLDRQIDVSIKAEKAKASSGASESPANGAGPRITFENLVCDLGQINPNTKYVCEFKYTNTGNEVLKITRVGVACDCTVPQKTRVCEPGESGTLKVTYKSGASEGKVRKNVYVHSNDKVNPRIILTIKAEIVIRVAHEPKKLNLVLDKENAGCPAVTLTSLDNQPFSITGFKSTGDSITADFDSSVKRTSLVVRPKVDMEKLRKGMRGHINVSLDHPECKKISVSFETLSEFKTDPRVVYVREAEPQKPITKKVRILSNYNEHFEIESTSSNKGTIKVLAREKIRDGYQFELQITPPEQESKRRVFTDVFTVELKGDRKLQVTCYGIYSRKPAETAGESLPKSDVRLEVAQSGGDSVYGSGDIVVVSEGKSKVYGLIQEAIDAAPAGSIVRIGPGVYKERLGINKPLTLEGAGWDKTTIITENNSADMFEEAMNTFRKRIYEAKSEEQRKKLADEFRAQFETEMKEKMAAQTHHVSDTGNVVIRNLKLTSPGRRLEGRALSVPVIKFSNAGALMSGCAVVGTPGNGINIEEGSDVQIRDSLVAGVWSTGIAVASGRGDIAKASIINCDVRNCHHRGITIGPGCDSTVVRGCRISGSSWHGIRYDNASPTIVGNLFFANVRFGIYASGRTAADVRQNLFYGNEMSGISCWFKNQDKIEENTFVANMRSGLEVLGASRPIVRKNIFYSNPTGVFCGNIGDDSPSAASDGTVNLEENLFWGFEYKVAWRHPGEAEDEIVTEEVKFDEKTHNVVFDPEFKDLTAEDFSLKLDSPARRSGIGAAVLIDYKSPWPLQDEEIPIIPEDKTEDTSWMGQISSTGKITRPVVVPVANKGGEKPQESIKAKPGKQEGSEHPGRISGVVVNSDTGDPIVGAYVGVGDFGDSGGSNYSRHRSEGFHDKTKTDAEGRFELGGLVFTDKHRYLKYHPLVVTHPDFVRHDRKIKLPSDGPAPDVKVNLMPAAKIEVIVVDADGNPLQGYWLLRLEALDGRRFIPPGSDPHLSSFASNIWAHWPDLRAQMGISSGFTFTELDTGEYSIEALKFRLVDKPSPGNIWEPTITYHGSIPGVRVQAGQAKQVRLAPQDHQTRLTITHPEYPDKLMEKLERSSQMPLMCLISRSPGALLWDDGRIRHLEDQRLGRIDKKRFFRGFFIQGKPLTINNLPPDSYSLFTMAVYGQVAGYLIGARADLEKGDKIIVDIPWRQPTGPSMFGPNRSFDYPVNLEAKDYSVSQICEILTEITQSNPRIIADQSIENEKLRFGKGDMSVWDLLEKLYLDNGWRVDEGQEKTLIIKPAEQNNARVEDEGGIKSSNNQTQPLSFGPVIECVVHPMDAEKDSFIDFDTGKYFDTPKKRRLLFDFEVHNVGHRVEWAKKTGADVTVKYSENSDLVMLWFYDVASKKVELDNWQDLHAEQIVQDLSKATHLVEDDLGFGHLRLKPPGATRIFKTREGGVGVIQIVGLTDNPKGVKIRYKMVQKGPAEQTNMPIEVKEREVGSVSVIRAVDNKATLISGVTVELLGLTEIPIKDNPWWKPDSSLLERPPFDNVSFDPSRDPNHDQFAYYAVAMRLKGKAPGEIGLIKWDLLDALHAGTTSAYLEDKRVYSQGIFGGASKFPKDVDTTTLRLGLAAGDWQTLVKGSHYGVYREGEDSIIVRTPERAGGPLGVGPGEKGLHIGVTYNVTDRDFRVVAVDKDGKVHVSARSGSGGTQNLRRTTASFPDLTRDKLGEFRFQTRPYECIEFRDISLRPGKEVVALAEKQKEGTKEELEKWLGRGQTRQIREQILVLRNCHIFKEMETWASAIRELVGIGRPAVPELLAEMRRSRRWPTQSTAAFALRAIGHPDSVQPLIEILGQVKYRGEYGIHLKDPKLSVFMLENQHRPARDQDRKQTDPQITIGCPVIEITAAMEKITGHTEGHEHYGHKAAAELGRDASHDKWQQRVQEIVRDVASRWQKWWEQNKDTVVSG